MEKNMLKMPVETDTAMIRQYWSWVMAQQMRSLTIAVKGLARAHCINQVIGVAL